MPTYNGLEFYSKFQQFIDILHYIACN